jgi:DNA topoisomerase-1
MAGGTEARPVDGGLRHSNDAEPGVSRKMGKLGFEYRDPRGRRIAKRAALERIHRLAVPPAWTHVWICTDARGHLQATGRDARGRKQYRYHARWREQRDADKFDRLLAFAHALPAIRRRVRTDLALAGLPRAKVLAAVVQLLERTCIRVGNERYAEANDSFGLTTLRNRHVKVARDRIEFRFRGKSGKTHHIGIEDPRLARIVRRCRDLPGQDLFEYLDEAGAPQAIGSSDVNAYLQEIAGDEFTTKDFRTWAGSAFVARELAAHESPVRASEIAGAVREAARLLGNTPAICRKAYVHPRVLDPRTWEGTRVTARRVPSGLRAGEAALLGILKRRTLSAPSRTRSPRRPIRCSSPRASSGPP